MERAEQGWGLAEDKPETAREAEEASETSETLFKKKQQKTKKPSLRTGDACKSCAAELVNGFGLGLARARGLARAIMRPLKTTRSENNSSITIKALDLISISTKPQRIGGSLSSGQLVHFPGSSVAAGEQHSKVSCPNPCPTGPHMDIRVFRGEISRGYTVAPKGVTSDPLKGRDRLNTDRVTV